MKGINSSLEKIIRLLEDHKLWYRVVGGIAIDAQIGIKTRQHNDIDIIVLNKEVEILNNILKNAGHPFKREDHKIYFYLDEVKIELGIFEKTKEGYHLKSEKHRWNNLKTSDHYWPEELLEESIRIFEGIQFKVPSKEFLLSTKLGDLREKGINDQKILLFLRTNKEIAEKYQFPPSRFSSQ